MKAFIKRYKVFLLLVLINVVIGLIIPDVGLSSASITLQNFMKMIL
jgi:hypothetical protein